jgi:hypothetical protein
MAEDTKPEPAYERAVTIAADSEEMVLATEARIEDSKLKVTLESKRDFTSRISVVIEEAPNDVAAPNKVPGFQNFTGKKGVNTVDFTFADGSLEAMQKNGIRVARLNVYVKVGETTVTHSLDVKIPS